MSLAFFRKSEPEPRSGGRGRSAAEDRHRARRRRRARLGAYRRAARTRRDRRHARRRRRRLDRRGGRRLLRGRAARRARGFRALADPAQRVQPPRRLVQRRRPDRRRPACARGSRPRWATLRIENLPIRFVAVATEIGAGHEVWLKSGPLVDAMRASYALPGVFEPVRIGGRWLFDGAIVNPVPVNVARAFGADWVIALAIGGDGRAAAPRCTTPADDESNRPRRPRRSRGRRMMRALRRRGLWLRRAWTARGGRARRRLGHGQHVQHHPGPHHALAPGRRSARYLMTLKPGKIGLFEFHRAAELIEIGRAAVRKARDEILEQLELNSALA